MYTQDRKITLQSVQLFLICVVACFIAEAGEPVPPDRPPKEKLTCNRKEVYEGRRILLDSDSYPRSLARLVKGPVVKREGQSVKISFALDVPDDVLVRVVGPKGETLRELACGVLGENAPHPFKKGSLDQEIVWDGKDTGGRPVPQGSRVRVAVGLKPRFERFVAYEPGQLSNFICGLEVDKKGRVYAALFTDRRGDPVVQRYDREGKYMDTVYPSNPNSLKGTLKDVFPLIERVDGREFPQHRGPWPCFMYKQHNYGQEGDPAYYQFPLRIGTDGRAWIAEVAWCVWSQGTPGKRVSFRNIRPLATRMFPVELDPFWFLKMTGMGSGTWALDRKGCAYFCTATGRSIRGHRYTVSKAELPGLKPVADFEYNGTEKLPEKRSYIGTPEKKGNGPAHFQQVFDMTVDGQGRIYVSDAVGLKIYESNGRFSGLLSEFDLKGKTVLVGDPCGVCSVDDTLYVVGRLEPMQKRIARKRPWPLRELAGEWAKAHLVKFRVKSGEKPTAIWKVPLNGLANFVAVDVNVNPHVVWVGNGGGLATLTRVVDNGKNPGTPRNIGGIKKGTLMCPWAIAVDRKGRVYVFDYGRHRIVRTNDDGSEWVESGPDTFAKSFLADRTRDRILRVRASGMAAFGPDLKELPVKVPARGTWNLGGIDREGNLVASSLGKTSLGKFQNGIVRRIGPDGKPDESAFIECFQGLGGLGADSSGCIYVIDTCKERFTNVAHNLGGRNPAWFRGDKRILSQSELAFLVKFGPGGGKRGTSDELWAHRGFSPSLSECKRCAVVTNSVAVDEADRVFATDYLKYHIKVLDTAGNLITRIGLWGNADCRGPKSAFPEPEIAFSWLHSIDVAGDMLFASDKDLRRIVKVRMDYRETGEVKVP